MSDNFYDAKEEAEEYYKELVIKRKRVKELEKQNEDLKKEKDMYKECFEKFIPHDKWDEATIFLSTYGSGLAKDILRRES